MFKPKYLKQAKLLQKGVKKFLNYKEDIIKPEKMEAIQGKLTEFDEAVNGREKEAIKESAKTLTKACERAVPPASSPGLRENLEVIFVAIIIAVGIRAYFLQPFRIPTGSMRPTLNGVIGHPHHPSEGEFDEPGFVGKAFEKVKEGRTYIDFTIPADSRIENFEEKVWMKFFYSTIIHFKDAGTPSIKVGVPENGLKEVLAEFNIGESRPGVVSHSPIKKDLRVRGYVDTGDQVLVNKFSYHFRRPARGEVFVFSTSEIEGIRNPDPRQSRRHSQHYIKRLTGVPGDTLEIKRADRGKLFINGEEATEEMIRRVWEGEADGYTGYSYLDGPARETREWDSGRGQGVRAYELGPLRYMAMGDNSPHSSDSRMWGSVPEENLVGPALMVYWPFEHWGTIH